MSKKVEEMVNDVVESANDMAEELKEAAENALPEVKEKKPGFLKKYGKTIFTHSLAFVGGVAFGVCKHMFFNGSGESLPDTEIVPSVPTPGAN